MSWTGLSTGPSIARGRPERVLVLILDAGSFCSLDLLLLPRFLLATLPL